MTFGDLRTQQISAIIFQCGVLYHTEFDIYLAIGLSLREISYILYAPRSFARANDAKIVRSRDAQCKTRESP